MEKRIEQELSLLRRHHANLIYVAEGRWVKLPSYSMPPGWNRATTDVVFQFPNGYPTAPPYGIYVPSGLTFKEQNPNNYSDPAGTQPPFSGSWAVFSWAPQDPWFATGDLTTGSNMLNWVLGFKERFAEGV